MLHAFAPTFPELQMASLPSQLFLLETAGFVKSRYMPVAIAGTMFAVQPFLFNLVGLAQLDPADVLAFSEVCFPSALHQVLTVQVEDVCQASCCSCSKTFIAQLSTCVKVLWS